MVCKRSAHAGGRSQGTFAKDRSCDSQQRVCGAGDVVVIPGGTEHEAWFREDTEVIDFFAPPRDDFLLGGKPAYMSEG
jgi:putative intracellular protease/amidase